MPSRRNVSTLLDHSISGISELISKEALRVSNVVVTQFVFDEIEAAENYEEFENLGEAWEREVYLKSQIDAFKDHLLSHIPPHLELLEKTLERGVLLGIQKAIKIKHWEWTPTTNATRYTREMYAIIAFCDILILPQRRHLDLNSIPKMIRSSLYSKLAGFKGLRTLILGCGSGGWVTESYSDSFLLGIPHFSQLVHFSLKYDSTRSILKCLLSTCEKTLRILDMEHSKQVNDDCLSCITGFKGLTTINVHQTDLSLEGQVHVVLYLPELVHLERGDFFCDVLDYCNDKNLLGSEAKLKIQEFFASEEYYFHSEDQMKRVSLFCPQIRSMTFMFEKLSCPTKGLAVLSEFQLLQELELWGGGFYTDGLVELLQNIGNQLSILVLVHVEEFDEKAFAVITACCQNLVKLSLINCEFLESIIHLEDIEAMENEVQEGGRQMNIMLQQQAKETRNILMPLLDLELLKVVSNCDGKYLSFMIGQCINIKELALGMSTGVSDEVIMKVLSKNSLSRLESIQIQKCSRVTMQGIELLLATCDRLKLLKDLEWFSGITKEEFRELSDYVKNENLDLMLHNEKSAVQEWHETDQVRRQKLLELVGGKKVPDFDNSIEWNTG